MSAPGAKSDGCGGRPRVHLLIPTHTTRHLDTALASLARQARPPDSVVITCDSDDPGIGALIDAVWSRVAARLEARGLPVPPLAHAFRPFRGQPRLNQVRNNGLRAIDACHAPRPSDLVLIVDGDTMLGDHTVERHAALAATGAEVVLAYRVNLDESTTRGISPEVILDAGGDWPERLVTPGAREALRRRARRLRRQSLLRRLLPGWMGIPKGHKPKILGGHHAVSVRLLRLLNGYDEEYRGCGLDDDDLALRLHRLRPRPKIAIDPEGLLAFHLYHPTRGPWRPDRSPDAGLFARAGVPIAARHGWANPLPQPAPAVRIVAATSAGPIPA